MSHSVSRPRPRASTRMRAVAPGCAWALLGFLSWAEAGCRSDAPTRAREEASEATGSGAVEEPGAPSDDEPGAGAPPSSALAEAVPDAGEVPSAEPPRTEPPDLVALMRAEGWPESSPADLLDFVPVPPGATGSAGVFGAGGEQVRVAVILYANDRFARPHRTDVEERRRVVPDLPEAVAQRGALVIHVRAGEREAADALAARLMERVERLR